MKFFSTSSFFSFWFLVSLVWVFPQKITAQFKLESGKKKDVISFELVNNLVIVPVELNGVTLSFLLDTGVNHTLLFGVSTLDSIAIKNATPVKLRGLGGAVEVQALKSNGNTLKVGGATDSSHDLYVVFDDQFNFSKRMGVPIHGILGYQLFKDFVIKTRYASRKLTLYKPESYTKKVCRKCEQYSLQFYRNKPYFNVLVGEEEEPSLVLIDSGSSDALWLFNEAPYVVEQPKNYFDDFLGISISGSIYGKRAKLSALGFKKFDFHDLTVAFPEILKADSISFVKNRRGSVGGEILKRFTVIMDYKNRKMVLKKNKNYKKPFYYNLSGLTLTYDGSIQIKELQDIRSENLSISKPGENKYSGQVNVIVDPVYSLFTAPKVVIAEIRPDSPAARAGLKVGDGLIKINGEYCYKFKLYELVELLSSKEGRKIVVSYDRDNTLFKTSFKLEKVL